MNNAIELKAASGVSFFISQEDADLTQYYWWVVRDHIRGRINKKQVYIHRVILERVLQRPLTASEKVDHVNWNPLDNTRDNLRLATHPQNLANRPKPIDNTSGYKGVSFIKTLNKWRATVGGKHIGVFNTPKDAAHAYDAIAIKKYGEFAVLNFPNELITFTPKVLDSGNTSGYRGVTRHHGKWAVEFSFNKKRIRTFGFSNPQDAARAYDELARRHLGDKAKLNFPQD